MSSTNCGVHRELASFCIREDGHQVALNGIDCVAASFHTRADCEAGGRIWEESLVKGAIVD